MIIYALINDILTYLIIPIIVSQNNQTSYRWQKSINPWKFSVLFANQTKIDYLNCVSGPSGG